MEPFEPVRDTIGLLAGASVRRSPRPGEQFERPEKSKPPRRIRSFFTVIFAGVMLSFRLVA